ncbi:expressed unknown protein [Seminavis robusta]|uniref:Uncharacterized protein n=1 Tax=Seminavis robusta TaxID=568900 RepID=A0A9N8EQ58_9STRA|nr:expressed unknown protein [Seminavis robusta]|eukprot:Sro1534_g280470.1 n/a (198) ;mRNA; r:13896-14489
MAAVAKGKFEKEKETILKSLPEEVTSMFGIMGFCKAEEDDDEDEENAGKATDPDYVPCLVLSPYSVPPRPVRDVYWWDFYSTRKRKKQLKKLEYLVYHYGIDDPLDCYSFVTQEDFVTYDDGLKAGYDKLPSAIQAKVDAGEELTEEEERRVRGLKEMNEDAEKPAEDRRRGNWEFKERHEQMEEKKGGPPRKRQKK